MRTIRIWSGNGIRFSCFLDLLNEPAHGEVFADQVLFKNVRCDHVYAHIAHSLSILKCIYSPHVDNSAVCVHQINKLFCEIGIIDARINIVLKYKRDIILAYITGQSCALA